MAKVNYIYTYVSKQITIIIAVTNTSYYSHNDKCLAKCCRFYFVHFAVCSAHVYEVQSQFHGDNTYINTCKPLHISF